mmetsp:Transcript_36886/g.56458  ORF Transcript_36886/g.56458 Transcript_36886/m.56458 type:complete len:260 (-) Transcript_36886:1031-1810(-)
MGCSSSLLGALLLFSDALLVDLPHLHHLLVVGVVLRNEASLLLLGVFHEARFVQLLGVVGHGVLSHESHFESTADLRLERNVHEPVVQAAELRQLLVGRRVSRLQQETLGLVRHLLLAVVRAGVLVRKTVEDGEVGLGDVFAQAVVQTDFDWAEGATDLTAHNCGHRTVEHLQPLRNHGRKQRFLVVLRGDEFGTDLVHGQQVFLKHLRVDILLAMGSFFLYGVVRVAFLHFDALDVVVQQRVLHVLTGHERRQVRLLG